MILFIRLIGFLGLPCLIFLNCMYIFNLNGKMVIKQNKKKLCPLALESYRGEATIVVKSSKVNFYLTHTEY